VKVTIYLKLGISMHCACRYIVVLQ
jgi:hypothetical protein